MAIALSNLISVSNSSSNAQGTITFTAVPAVDDTLTVDGVAFTFKDASSGPTEITRGASASAAATNTASILNASADTDVAAATYAASGDVVSVIHDTAGSAGTSFTLAKSSGGVELSGGTLSLTPAGATNVPDDRLGSDWEKSTYSLIPVVQALITLGNDPTADRTIAYQQRVLLKDMLRVLADELPTTVDATQDDRVSLGNAFVTRASKRFGKLNTASGL